MATFGRNVYSNLHVLSERKMRYFLLQLFLRIKSSDLIKFIIRYKKLIFATDQIGPWERGWN